MGIEGRPERGSKVKAMHKLTNHDNERPIPSDDDSSAPQRPARKKPRRHIDSDESPQKTPVPDAIRQATASASRALDASRRRDERDYDPEAELSDLDEPEDNDRISDPDHLESPVQRIVKLRLPVVAPAVHTRSGRLSKRPAPDPLSLPMEPQQRRRSSVDLTDRTSGELSSRYPRRRRTLTTYGEEPGESEEFTEEQIRPSRSRKRTSHDARLDRDGSPLRRTRSDEDDADHIADDDDDEERFINPPKNGRRLRNRLNKLAELEQTPSPQENRRQTRASRRVKSGTAAFEQRDYYPRRSKTGGKEPKMQNGSARKDEDIEIDGEDGEPDVDAARESDGDFKVTSEPESDDGEHDEPLQSQDLLQTPAEPEEEDDENDPDHDENPRRRSLRSRNRNKSQPQRNTRKSRKRLRNTAARQENSLAKRARESYRPRNESVRRSDFYNGDAESESSDSSDALLTEGRRRPTREAATRATDRIAHANDLSKLDFLQNPMSVPDVARAPRPKRRSSHRGRMRPSRHEAFVSDDDDISATAGAATIEPIQVDPNLSWEDIGGLDHHVRALKEMVFLPLMYPEVFEKFKMEAPKGVLFYGPPGTGKTLCARALAASCGAELVVEPGKPEDKAAGAASSSAQKKEAGKITTSEGANATNGDVEMQPARTQPDANSLNVEAAKIIEGLITADSEGKLRNGAEKQERPAEDNPDKPAAVAEKTPDANGVKPTASEQKPPVKKKPRVAFFMRNGADCLSKWVGEAERQLRMTFEAAKRHQPAIIFFDEIDGLAPVRSSRQDQIHASIVSTLLGLMDGLDSRGKIVVIGATNRVDAIDPALRRPGRFDRELIFTLPNAEARKKILRIHTKDWKPPPKDRVIDAVGKLTVGYCGADLKALCSEAAIRALRRRYPQIYHSNDKLLIDIDQVLVGAKDFMSAMKDVVPASHRSAISHARPIPDRLAAVLNGPLRECLVTLQRILPQGLAHSNVDPSLNLTKPGDSDETSKLDNDIDSSDEEEDDDQVDIQIMQSKMQHAGKLRANSRGLSAQSHSLRPRLLVCGAPGLGQTQLGPAILHHCEGCPVHAIDFPTLHAESGARSPQEALISAFREASASLPSILYLPHLEMWWSSADESLKTMLSILLNQIPADSPLLVLATAEVTHNQLPQELMNFFVEVHELGVPTEDNRKAMFAPLITAAQKAPTVSECMAQQKRRKRAEEVLPKAPPPPPKKLSKDEEMRKLQGEARYIRVLRMEMRSFVESLLRDRRFKAFWAPVDPTSAPDYYEIIKNPMDIQKIAANVDAGRYPTVVAMVNDFDVMVRNAIQYNPPNTEVGAQILRRAHGLIDIVHAWVDNLNPSLVETCNKIIAERVERAKAEESGEVTGEKTGENRNEMGGSEGGQNEKEKEEKMDGKAAEGSSDEAAAQQDATASQKGGRRPDVMDVDALVNPTAGNAEVEKVVVVEATPSSVDYLANEFGAVSSGMTVDGLEGLYVQCEKVVFAHRRNPDRAETVRAVLSSVAQARDDPALVSNLVE